MSEFINNSEMRKNTLKNILRQLHEGKSVDEVKKEFQDVFGRVAASEISDIEAELVKEGLPVSEIQNLCDVHSAVFKGSIEEIHRTNEDPREIPGHPTNILIKENRKIQDIIEKDIKKSLSLSNDEDMINALKADLENLLKIDIHYKRKENVIFPYMEKKGMETPAKVMWGVDDEIREMIKSAKASLEKPSKREDIENTINRVTSKVNEMIFKEENILIPMLIEQLTEEEWGEIYESSKEIGFMIDEIANWKAKRIVSNIGIQKEEAISKGYVNLPSGKFKIEELTWVLNTLPFDITFVDKDNCVKYFSEGKERTFPRARSIIGRNVSNCHPPASVHIVEKIVDDLRNGVKDNEDFWIKMKDKYVLIRYFAVRNDKNEYLGVLEVTQDIKGIQEITGEKRLVSE